MKNILLLVVLAIFGASLTTIATATEEYLGVEIFVDDYDFTVELEDIEFTYDTTSSTGGFLTDIMLVIDGEEVSDSTGGDFNLIEFDVMEEDSDGFTIRVASNNVPSIPEPSAMALLALGAFASVSRRRT